jgi:predicted nucleic-acid-binding Zn-ribbon protein
MNVKKTIKKWAGRGIAVVLGAMLLGSSIPAVTSQAGTENVKTTCTTYSGDNVEDQTYSKWASTIKSYLTYNSDGSFMRVQAGAVSDGYLVEYYDSNYNLTGTKIVAEELSIFGGFYEMGDYYYILTGQKNSEESDDVEVYRITKYDKNWTRIKSCGLYGANTYIPFEAGSARMTEYGDYLMIRTCHEMYVSSDGYHHQANVTIQVDTTSMEVVDSYYSIMNSSYGYVSHSFNQFIQMENGKIVSVDHGDAHPRSIVLIKYPSAVTSNGFTKYGCKTTDLITFEGETGVNYTGASVGGFEISDTAYLVAGSQDIDTTLSSTYTKGRNIFVAVESKSTGTVSVNYITDYELGTGTTDTPQFVKIANNSYLLLWHRGDSIYYTKIDGNGNQVGSIYSMEGDLSDCVPVVAGNRLVWYTWKNETIKFYEISLTDISSNDVTTIVNGHKFTYSDVDEDDYTVTKTCTECGYSEKFYVVKSFTMYWKKDESSSSYYPSYNSRYDVGATVKYWVYSKSINTATDDISANEEMTVIVEDDSIISLSNTTSSQGTLTMLKPGITTVTIYPTYNPSAAKSYVFRVGEEGSLDINDCEVKLSQDTYEYTGSEFKPTAVVTYNGTTLTSGTDYTLSYADNKNAGEATVTITGAGLFAGTKDVNFTIEPLDISEGTVSLKEKELVYNGSSQVPELTVNIGDVLLVSEKDYTVVLPDAVNTGDYTVTVTGKGNYKGSIDTAYSIIQKDIADADATLEADKYIYDGTEKEPAVNIVVSGTELKENSDYTVEYENNIEIGEATVIVTGQGNYTGSKKVQFIIKSDTSDKDGNNTTEGNDNNTSEDNGNVTPGDKDNNTSEGSGNVIPGDKDNNASEGNENVIPGDNDNNITDEAGSNKTDGDPDTSGNSISVAKTSITSIANTSSGIKLTWKKISGATGYIVYRKTASSSKWTKVKTITKAATVSYTDKAVKSKNGQKYVYKIETYKVTDSSSISSTSNQKNIVRLTAPAKLKAVNISSKKMKLTWAKNKKVTGYQIQYSTSKTFAKGNKTVKVSKATLKKTISKLKKGKTYYVRIRAYCKDSSGISYSAWSSKKTVKIKK